LQSSKKRLRAALVERQLNERVRLVEGTLR
jgi:hypothetical protein